MQSFFKSGVARKGETGPCRKERKKGKGESARKGGSASQGGEESGSC